MKKEILKKKEYRKNNYITKKIIYDTTNMNILEIELAIGENLIKIEDIKIGDYVKVSNFEERFWVKIFNIDKDIIFGKIDNFLLDNKLYDINSLITFHVSNILDHIKYN